MRLLRLALLGAVTSLATAGLRSRPQPSTKSYETERRLSDHLAAYSANMATLAPLLISGNLDFLASLSQLPHQTTGNLSDPHGGNNWAIGERDYINGLVDAVNRLQSHLQANGFEA
jgi:hypothetical protein